MTGMRKLAYFMVKCKKEIIVKRIMEYDTIHAGDIHLPVRRGGLPRWQCIGLLWWLVFSLLVLYPPAWAQDYPFKPGERLTYVLKWGFIPAGKAVLEVQPMTEVEGQTARHFVLTARSNNFIDNFYKVRDRIDAYADAGMQHSVHFAKKQREGNYKRDVVVTFDWTEKQAQYANKGKKDDPISLMPGSFDPLSAFYFIRSMEMQPGSKISKPITDGRKNVVGEAKVIKRETINVGGQPYDTFLIVPDLKHVGGVFKESKNAKMQIWVTADHRRIPVRLKSKVVVGSFVGELVKVEGL